MKNKIQFIVVSIILTFFFSCQTINRDVSLDNFNKNYSQYFNTYMSPSDYEDYIFVYKHSSVPDTLIYVQYSIMGDMNTNISIIEFYNSKKILEQKHIKYLNVYNSHEDQSYVSVPVENGELKEIKLLTTIENDFITTTEYSDVFFSKYNEYGKEIIKNELKNIEIIDDTLIITNKKSHTIITKNISSTFEGYSKEYYKKEKGLVKVDFLTNKMEVYNTYIFVKNINKKDFWN